MGVLTSARILTFGGQYKSGSGRLSGGQHPRGQLGGVNAMTPPVVGASNKNYGETKQIVKLYQIQFEGSLGHRTLIFCTVGVKVHIALRMLPYVQTVHSFFGIPLSCAQCMLIVRSVINLVGSHSSPMSDLHFWPLVFGHFRHCGLPPSLPRSCKCFPRSLCPFVVATGCRTRVG